MLRKLRIALAAVFFVGITLLLAGIGAHWWGWMAKLQFLPACLALNFAVVAAIVILTLVFGRIYCSVICPLGVFQDIVISIRREAGKLQKKCFAKRAAKAKASGKPVPKMNVDLSKKFGFKKEHKVLRYSILAVFVICLVLGLQVIVALVAPYSAYGRMVQSVISPSGWAVPVVAFITFVAVVYLAWTDGRSWCNNICPVGTVLSFFSRFSLFQIRIDESKCIKCGKCYRNCKASCIDGEAHKVDCSRCVSCFDCIGHCTEGAVRYRFAYGNNTASAVKSEASSAVASANRATLGNVRGGTACGGVGEADVCRDEQTTGEGQPCGVDESKRAFMVGALMAGTAATLGAQEAKLDGGLAAVIGKKAPKREQRLTPPGSKGEKHFYDKCTACQLCVANCPNNVLHPSTDLGHLMQPKMDFDKGFCRPECTECSQVCPAGAILPITPEEKTAIHIGRATVDYDLCVAYNDGINCGSCASHCPAGAISMVRKNPDDPQSPRIPSVIEERCIGCGKCEYLCPARPFSAIHIEGLKSHIED